MKRLFLTAVFLLAWGIAPACGYIAMPPSIGPLYQRVAWSDLIRDEPGE